MSFTMQDAIQGHVKFSHSQEDGNAPLHLYSSFDIIAEYDGCSSTRRSVMIRVLPYASLIISKPGGVITQVP